MTQVELDEKMARRKMGDTQRAVIMVKYHKTGGVVTMSVLIQILKLFSLIWNVPNALEDAFQGTSVTVRVVCMTRQQQLWNMTGCSWSESQCQTSLLS